MMKLTNRDIQILLKINECLWLSTKQIKSYFFPSTTMRAINKRLKMLVNEGYLICRQPSKTEEYYFKLGKKAKHVLIEETEIDSEHISTTCRFPAHLKHFSTLNDLRWYFETSINNKQGELHFFFVDRELPDLLGNLLIIPDILVSFSVPQEGQLKRYMIALEYDAGTENPQYFGRDKVKKYYEAYERGHFIFTNNNSLVVTFADSTKRVDQLIKYSKKFIDDRIQFLFASLEDLKMQSDIFANIYVDPKQNEQNKERDLCSLIY